MLSGKIVVITGGAGLIGQRFCQAVAESGGHAVIAENNAAAAAGARDALARWSDSISLVAMDITAPASVQAALAEVVARLGKVDALVNCAYPRNARYGRHFFDVDFADFNENVSMSLGGYFLTSQTFAATSKSRATETS